MDMKNLGRRVLSLVLALELFVSPVAMAQAASPPHIFTPETPYGEEALDRGETVDETQPTQGEEIDPATEPSQSIDTDGAQTLAGEGQTYTHWALAGNKTFAKETVRPVTWVENPSGYFDPVYGAPATYYRLDDVADGDYSYTDEYNLWHKLMNLEVPAASMGDMDNSIWTRSQGNTRFVGAKAGETGKYAYLPALLDARLPDFELVKDSEDASPYQLARQVGAGYEPVRSLGPENGEELDVTVPNDVIGIDSHNPTDIGVKLQEKYETVNDEGYLPLGVFFKPSTKAFLTGLSITSYGEDTANKIQLETAYTSDPLNDAITTHETVALDDFTNFKTDDVGDKTGTPFGAKEIWVQLGSDQRTLDLHFQTYEPFYQYNKPKEPSETCPVAVTYTTADGGSTSLTLTRSTQDEGGNWSAGNLVAQYLPRAKWDAIGNINANWTTMESAQNTAENRARGDWDITNVPIESDRADITVTVTAPDGATQETYTIHVLRRQKVEGEVTGNGNTPYGMIERDENLADKTAAKEAFLNSGFKFSTIDTLPTGDSNNGGAIYRKYAYTTGCWPSDGDDSTDDNIDKDPTAIVAYLDMRFDDPGVSFTDSYGRKVYLPEDYEGDSSAPNYNDLKNRYAGTVTRTIRLRVPRDGVLSADSWNDLSDNYRWYNVNAGNAYLTGQSDQASQILTSLNQEVDLRGLKVLPGVYTITYQYTDNCADATGGGVKTQTLTRRLVILPIPGDVDMDGAVTVADAYALQERMGKWTAGGEFANVDRVKLGIGRVFDLDGNGALEAADYKRILDGFQPELDTGNGSDYFYLPLPKEADTYERKNWADVDALGDSGSGSLKLEFLGVEQGTTTATDPNKVDAAITNPQGPFAPKMKTGEDGSPTTDKADVTLKNAATGEDNSIFWMGVKVADAGDLAGSPVESLTVSLTYDYNYVRPVWVYTQEDAEDYAETGATIDWEHTVRKYNINQADANVLWYSAVSGATNKPYEIQSAVSGRNYTTHYSKVKGELESAAATNTNHLKELVVTFKLKEGFTPNNLETGKYLLVVPFKLIAQPQDAANTQVRLIELSAGMRDLTLVTKARAVSPVTAFFADLFGLERAAGETTTNAFSAQSEIFGGTTDNLRGKLAYDHDSGKVPLGSDETPRKDLEEAVYGEAYAHTGYVGTGDAPGVIDNLPPGLTYDAANRKLVGTPMKTGTYEFKINNIPYRVVVKEKTLHYMPKSATTYYGETEYRGEPSNSWRTDHANNRNFEFFYKVADLAPDDLAYAQEHIPGFQATDTWRDGAELETILGHGREETNQYNDKKTYTYNYLPPQFIADSGDGRGNPVTPFTEVKNCAIKTVNFPNVTVTTKGAGDPSVSYDLEQVEDPKNPRFLSIISRPVVVDHITSTADDTGLAIYHDGLSTFTGKVLYDKKDADGSYTTEIALSLPDDGTDDGMFNGHTLTGDAKIGSDRVAIQFDGAFIHESGDTDSSFILSEQKETRKLRAYNLRRPSAENVLDNNGNRVSVSNTNYHLQDTSIQNPDANNMEGTVILRGVTEMELTAAPFNKDHIMYYGARIENPKALMVRVVLGSGGSSTSVIKGEYQYNARDLLPMQIHYNWVTPEEYQQGMENPTSLDGSGIEEGTDDGGSPKLVDTRPYGFNRDYLNPEDWDATMLDAEKHAYRDNYLYPDMDGWRICACVAVYTGSEETGQVQYIKQYTDPIQVHRRPLTITAVSANRYYGEDLTDSQLTFRFNNADLIAKDAQYIQPGASYNMATLQKVFQEMNKADPELALQSVPTIEAVKTLDGAGADNQVTRKTPVAEAGKYYYLKVSGGESDCYEFRFANPESNETRSDYGYAYLNIMKRPVYVDAIRGNGADGEDPASDHSFPDIYSDTKHLVVTHETVADENGEKKPLEAAGPKVDFKLPQFDPVNNTTTYYTANSTGEIYKELNCSFPEGTTMALVPGDDVRVRYQARYVPDEGRYAWVNFATGFFNNSTIDDTLGYAGKDVQVEKMELTGSDAANYVLVYPDDASYIDRVPASSVHHTVQAPKGDATDGVKTYYVSGTGRVHLRPIQALIITSLGKMKYTYGDPFLPNEPDTVGGDPMTAQVSYETKYENNPETLLPGQENVTQETVEYIISSYVEGRYVSSFEERGFTIYYFDKPNAANNSEQMRAAKEAAIDNGQILDNTSTMVPADHNGMALFITGKRSEGDTEIWSTMDDTLADQRLIVNKGALTLTAGNQHKIYGEPNPADQNSFTFQVGDLAQLDQDKLSGLSGQVDGQELKKVLTAAEYQALVASLRYSTTATAASGVGSNGKWGEYPLSLSITNPGILANYTVSTQGRAHLYVYPRPIEVSKINSTKQSDPVYTIYNDPSSFGFNTEMSTRARDGKPARVEVAVSALGGVTTVHTADKGELKSLPVSGTGLYGADNLTFKARVDYEEFTFADITDKDMEVTVIIQGLQQNETAQNYTWDSGTNKEFKKGTPVNHPEVWGSAKLRTIESIQITGAPAKLEYIYGQPLDLAGLQVKITYKASQGENAPAPDTVNYEGPDQFKSMGLYVNYWDSAYGELPTDLTERRELPGKYWQAATGDHITIAPTHDTQQYIGTNNTDPKMKPFAANGKYLVISAFQAINTSHGQTAADQPPAEPKILGAVQAGNIYEGDPTPIVIHPRKLSFTLSAQDKTYDGTTEAAGTLTLTNLFGSGSTADVVYVPFGADYETGSMKREDFRAKFLDTNKVVDGQVSFRTGEYQKNGEAPLGDNGIIAWASGYTWGEGLTFTFPNPNVHYVDDSGVSGVGDADKAQYWRTSQPYEKVIDQWDTYNPVTQMPVEVTNMVIQGPDAANYTWGEPTATRVDDTDVLMTTRAAADDGQDAVPFATIHKANRKPIQQTTGYGGKFAQLVVDQHTNVIKLLLDQALTALGDDNNRAGERYKDEFRNELHFEYALLYPETDQDGNKTGLLAQWAGKHGTGRGYQDTVFFGGETVKPTLTATTYQPTLDTMPKAETANENTIYKGQLYQWAHEDTGKVTVGGHSFTEDGGFTTDPAAYPGVKSDENGLYLLDKEGNKVYNVEELYWYYNLYQTDRKNLPRNTVFYPLVRLSETHNYLPSGNLTGDANVTAELLDDAQKALEKYHKNNNEANYQAALAASQKVFEAAAVENGLDAAAQKASEDQIALDAEIGETSRWPEEGRAPIVGPAAAIKTLNQRIDLVSVENKRSQDPTDDAEYLVELLEAVWFTDTLTYEEEKHFSAAVYNHPTRYYGYYWDRDLSARLEFNPTALNFTSELQVEIREKGENNVVEEKTVTVNTLDETVGGRVAKIYVQINGGGGSEVRKIQIVPTALYARLGDDPYPLSWVSEPKKPSNRRFKWTSSDPSVATVDNKGVVTFRGIGTCTITLTTDNRKMSSITVTVSEPLPELPMEGETLFNFQQNQGWMALDENDNFYPELPMTRAQVVELLDLFLNPNAQWTPTTELPYVDITGQEKYIEALRRLSGAGVVKGLPGSAFGGNQNITRAEFITMVARMLQLDTPDTKGKTPYFADSGPEDTWAYRYIEAMAKTGVIRGVGGGDFAPGRVLTRQEAAAVIARLVTVKLDTTQEGLKVPADMTPDNWSYRSVLRAVNTVLFPEPTVKHKQ